MDPLLPRPSDDPAPTAVDRRRVLFWIAGTGAAVLATGCATKGDSSAGTSSTTTASSTTASTAPSNAATGAACAAIPEETAGPFPGDGSNGPDALGTDGVVRRDIRSSFGGATGIAEGVPLEIRLTILDGANGCAPLPGAAVYAWHCDREGRYSMYSPGVTDENWLRGVQPAGDDGTLSFTSVFPGAYSGRWPHVHFEVYESVDAATGGGRQLATSQLAVPADVCELVYATGGYEQSQRNFPQTTLRSDMVFGDDLAAHQLATMSGSVADGLVATLAVTV